MNGVLVIDKPRGLTSHDVVARVRRASGLARVGHTGTLDPLATGVLPLVVGRATRLARFMSAADKDYIAAIRLGWSTDTYDATGVATYDAAGVASRVPQPEGRGVVEPGRKAVEAVLDSFRGTYLQQPPPFSAKKIAGVRAYALARKGDTVQPAPVRVTVSVLDLLSLEGSLLTVLITCTAGFYVRALAHAVGERLGTGAHIEALRRTRSGTFDERHALPVDEVERDWPAAMARIVPLETLLPGLPRFTLTDEGVRRVSHGHDIDAACLMDCDAPFPEGPVRLVDGAGSLLAIAEQQGAPAVLHPAVVLI
jgi:tRNA pseudouridine55 synthase